MVPSGILRPGAGTNSGLPVSIDSPAYTVPSGIAVPISGAGSACTERDATTIKTTQVAQTSSARVLMRAGQLTDRLFQPHLESPQFRQVMQLSIMTTAAVLHLAQSAAPSGKCDFANASCCLVRASNSARFSSTIFF